MPSKPPKPCRRCGRAANTRGLCEEHARQNDRQRGTSTERGYTSKRHRDVFRTGVLSRDGWECVLCGEPASIADHYPRTRKQLIADGDDPDDPTYGRALCKRCHDRHTASTSIARRE